MPPTRCWQVGAGGWWVVNVLIGGWVGGCWWVSVFEVLVGTGVLAACLARQAPLSSPPLLLNLPIGSLALSSLLSLC